MAFKDDHEEVNSKLENLSTQEWEEAYELLHKKCSRLKRENKFLKNKITECVHDTSLLDELELCKKMLEEEREDKEGALKFLDEIKLRVQQMDKEIHSHLDESKSLSIANQRLKSELETTLKALAKSKNKLNKFVKGKEALDSLTMITSNKEKRGLDFQGESSQYLK